MSRPREGFSKLHPIDADQWTAHTPAEVNLRAGSVYGLDLGVGRDTKQGTRVIGS
jgi:hypothetical protein